MGLVQPGKLSGHRRNSRRLTILANLASGQALGYALRRPGRHENPIGMPGIFLEKNTSIYRGMSMYCRHCGKEVKDKAVVCSGCGHPIEDFSGQVIVGHPWNWFTMIGLIVLTLFVPPAGLVFGIIGLLDPAKKVQGAVVTTISVFMTLLLIAVISGL
jgi:RNA polymerase subunit RPABC4/transcription elongation factor Spt4